MGITRIRLRGGTAADWRASNPILAKREPGYETDTRQIKFGDGAHHWNDLPYGGIQGPAGQTRPSACINFYNEGGISDQPANFVIWRAPYACTLIAIRGWRTGGTGATVNTRRNGADENMAADLSLDIEDSFIDGGVLQNTDFAEGDVLEALIKTALDFPTLIVVQVEFEL